MGGHSALLEAPFPAVTSRGLYTVEDRSHAIRSVGRISWDSEAGAGSLSGIGILR